VKQAPPGPRLRLARAIARFLAAVLPPLMGLVLLVGLWAIVSIVTRAASPARLDTWKQALDDLRDPFYRKGPNDQGVGWNVLMSLERVALGFGLAARWAFRPALPSAASTS
jgi:nitrate/nitrite transport system permease protein